MEGSTHIEGGQGVTAGLFYFQCLEYKEMFKSGQSPPVCFIHSRAAHNQLARVCVIMTLKISLSHIHTVSLPFSVLM